MSIIRGRLSGDGFTQVPNHWLRDRKLSYKGKGLLAAIASHRDDYELTIEQLITESRDGKDAVATGLKELERVGYLRRLGRQRRSDGTLGAYDYELVESPHNPTTTDSVSAGQSQRGKPAVAPARKTRTGHQQEKQGVSAGHNQCGFTTVVNPPHRRPGVENQKKTSSPSPPAPTATEQRPAQPDPGQQEGEEEPDTTKRQEPSTAALAMVDAAPWQTGHQPTTAQRARLAHAVTRCLAAGHSTHDVQHELDGSIPGAHTPVGSALANLTATAERPPATTAANRPHSRQADRGPTCPNNPLLPRGRCGCCDPVDLPSPTADGPSRPAASLVGADA